METKVTILGEAEAVKPELKKIEFVRWVDDNLHIRTGVIHNVNEWGNITLISKNYKDTGYDLMFAHDNGYRDGKVNNSLFFGYFNDGVV